MNNLVLARKDMSEPYNQENCIWRPPYNKWEERMGIEQISLLEPDVLPLSSGDKKVLKNMTAVEKRMFYIWKRMMWRAEVYVFSKYDFYELY